MDIIDTPKRMQMWAADQHANGRIIGLVPTMGALHGGHLTLIDEAARRADVVVVSIFVNPLQFNRRDDFDLYPRDLDDDLRQCRDRQIAAVYAPSQAAMYPNGFETHVEPGTLASTLEGASRPGHFRGVTTVVTKLFNAVRPDVAVFGEKDFQQLAIIRRMVIDLDMGIDIVAAPTVREDDGLALSSRNTRLTADQRTAARVVPRALDAIESGLGAGTRDAGALQRMAADIVAAEPEARLEYVELVDPANLGRRGAVEQPTIAVIGCGSATCA